MKHKIATLDVFVDSDTDGMPSGLFSEPDKGKFQLVIKPNVDKQFLDAIPHDAKLDPMQSIIAHELGHFVSFITKDPTHKSASTLNFYVPLVPTEQKAWDIAEAINPKVDSLLKSKALESYIKRDAILHSKGNF